MVAEESLVDAIKYKEFQYYTYDDYKNWEDRWELIGGVVYSMSPAPYPKHQRVVFKISKELDSNLTCDNKKCEVYLSPVDWKIDEHTVVQPDVAIFCEDTAKQYFTKTPPLVVEVLSKSTALKDVTTKLKLYEREGVEYYIIIEPNTQISDILKLIDGEFQLMKKATIEDSYSFKFTNGCEALVEFGKIF